MLLALSPISVFADIIGETDQEVQAIADPVLDNILVGFEQTQYEIYARDFDATLKEAVSERKFIETDQWVDNTLGSLESKEYLGFLSQANMTIILWKGKFAINENDVLIKLIMSKRGDDYVVTGLWFQ